MRNWYFYSCKNCSHEYHIHLGWAFPSYDRNREAMFEIASGTYGHELQEICSRTQYAAVNPEETVFICDGCGTLEVGPDMTLYAPEHTERIAQKKFEGKTAAELGYVPYVYSAELEKDYRVVRKFCRYCRKCGNRMHKASPAEMENLPCPVCGTVNRVHPEQVRWD